MKKFDYLDIDPMSTPFDSFLKLAKIIGKSVPQHRYSHIIGSLVHLANHITPHIAYAMGRLGRFTYNPNADHWHV